MRALILLCVLALPASARTSSCDLAVIVDGASRPEYVHHETTYVEALRGREYALRITNPTSSRVAVALSVDGLNTIDAKHGDAWSASKWVLDPYETVEIAGWQVSDAAARKFTFTGEKNSYGAKLGRTENLGVIEAVFYREHVRVVPMQWEGAARDAGAPAPQAKAEASLSDDYAATGMGDRTRHEVTRVDLQLDPQPISSVRIRYEFRPQLVKLGVLPEDGLRRREKAKGFEGYCPE